MHRNIYTSTYEENTLLFKEQTVGLLEDDFLTYHTDNDTIRINLNNFSFTKENVESLFRLNKNRCLITLKEEGGTFEIPIDYINYEKVNNKNIIIEYKLASQEKNIKIIIEIGDEQNEI